MNPYDINYLNDAMRSLGEACEYAAKSCGMSLDLFMELFTAGEYAQRFGKGEPAIVSGMSGTELAESILKASGYDMEFPDAVRKLDDPPEEFWFGWFFAYFQWYANRSFKYLLRRISIESFTQLAVTLNTGTKEWQLAAFEGIKEELKGKTPLHIYRRECRMSQRVLAERTGVNLRTLQQYETGAKDLKKAAGTTLKALADRLGCSIEDLLED